MATNSVKRSVHPRSASHGLSAAPSAAAASMHSSISCCITATMRSDRRGKCRYSVPTPTPARSVISFAGASTPRSANTVLAACTRARTFRCASERCRREGSALPAVEEGCVLTDSGATAPLAKRKDIPYSCGKSFRLTSAYLDAGPRLHVALASGEPKAAPLALGALTSGSADRSLTRTSRRLP